MSCRSRRRPAGALAPAAVVYALGLFSPGSLAAQQAREIGIQSVFTAAEPVALTGGLYGAVRTTRRTRFALTAGAGGSDGELVWRTEVLGQFLLNPGSVRKAGFYAGGGVALTGGPEEHGFVVVMAGIEGTPGAPSGWALEAGLGGGFRAAVGYRWRGFRRRDR